MLSLLATAQGGASSPDDASHVCQVIDNVARASLHLQPIGTFSQHRPKGTEGTSSMTYFPLTKTQREWQERIADLAQREVAPRAAETDRTGQYPQESLETLQRAGLWGLRVSEE